MNSNLAQALALLDIQSIDIRNEQGEIIQKFPPKNTQKRYLPTWI